MDKDLQTGEYILAVDDNHDGLYALQRILEHAGFSVNAVGSGHDAIVSAKSKTPSLVLLDVMMPKIDGYEVIATLKKDAELRFVPIILLTAKSSLDDITEGLDRGADDYITKPYRPDELLSRVNAALRMRELYQELRSTKYENANLMRQLSVGQELDSIVGESEPMKRALSLAKRYAVATSPVLITGPSGTGKELFARVIHFNSDRAAKPIIAKNCATFSETLLESELFGHVKGAFTGAVKDSEGLLSAAEGGTLFLDEVGELHPALQAKMLRVLQEGSYSPVGSTEVRAADVRIIAATNRNLEKMVEERSFREDLFYRLHVLTLELPALRQRKEDLNLLIDYFLRERAASQGIRTKELTPEAVAVLLEYDWKGNVRELKNELERMIILGAEQAILTHDLISERILRYTPDDSAGEGPGELSLKQAIESLEKDYIAKSLDSTGGNKSASAKELGISRSSLIAKVQQYGLE